MALLEEIAQRLADDGFGAPSVDIFAGWQPEDPDGCICLYEGEAVPSFMLGANPGVPHAPAYSAKRLQVTVRRGGQSAYPDASAVAYEVWRKLSLVEVTLSGTRYLLIEPTNEPLPLDLDDKLRVTFVVNFDCVREMS